MSGLRETIAETSALRRFMYALLVLLPLAALTAAYLWFNPPDYRVLYAQLSDRSGGEIITALDQLDIPYRLSATDGTIEVPAGQLHAARYRLAARGLPKSDSDAQDEADRAPRFGASSLQEQQRFQHALEIDLARSIQQLDAVEFARVHLALPRVSPFLRDAPPATAAVLVRLRPGAQLSTEQVTTIQTLVAAGVPRMQRTEVQVLDPRGVVLGGADAEVEPTPRLLLEQDLARRVRAVLAPWLGDDRFSVQVTATLDERETRQTTERVRNVMVNGQARPQERTVLTTRVPEGRIQRINAIVVLGFDAGAAEIGRVRNMAGQALGLQPARGDRLSVYALPAASRPLGAPAARAEARPPVRIPEAKPASPPPAAKQPFELQPWQLAAAGLLIVLGAMAWLRARPTPIPDIQVDDFDAALDAARNQVLADPRVAADVIKLWMRA